MNYLSRSFGLVSGVILGMWAGGKATAAEMNLDTIFTSVSGAPANATVPWLEYRLEDFGANSAVFTLAATPNLTDPEKLKQFYFNFDDTLSLANLNFTVLSTAGAFTVPTITQTRNALKAGGDGFYDVRLSFDTSGGLASYFNAGDSLRYLVSYTGAGTMAANSFEFLSQPGGGERTYYAAAHVQSTPGGGGESVWLGATEVTYPSVPEPSTAALVLLTLAMVGARRRS